MSCWLTEAAPRFVVRGAKFLEHLRGANKAANPDLLRMARSLVTGVATISGDARTRLAASIREVPQDGDPAFRKAYLRLFLDQMAVGTTEIRMRGPTAALAKAATVDALPPTAGMVPGFVREWRPIGDSNPCCRRERAVS